MYAKEGMKKTGVKKRDISIHYNKKTILSKAEGSEV